MQEHKVEFRETEHQPGQRPAISHAPQVIDQPTVFTHAGNIVGIYTYVGKEEWFQKLRAIAMQSPMQKSSRMNGVGTKSAVYGSLPRVAARNVHCRITNTSQELPRFHHGVEACAQHIDDLYKELLPEAYQFNRAQVQEQIVSEYHLGGSVFTTCNFNFNHAIPYHRDTGNIKNVYSNVIILKKGMIGGELVFPEWGVTLAQDDGYLGIFDGQAYLHGVTPVNRTHPKGYRCSTVFYALESMRNCLPPEEELEHARQQRDKIESNFRNEIKSR